MNPWVTASESFRTRRAPGISSPFVATMDTRPLRILVDVGLGDSDAGRLLLHFSEHPQVEIYDLNAQCGAEISFSTRGSSEDRIATLHSSTGREEIVVPATNLRKLATRLAATGAPSPSVTDNSYFEGLMRERLAGRLEADVFVTDRGWLISYTNHHECAVLDLADAIAVVGSFLRRQGDFRTGLGDMNSPRLFGRIFANVLLPRRGEWTTLVDRERGHDDDETYSVGPVDSLIGRLTQAIRFRDLVHWALLGHGDDDEVLLHFDASLLTLHAAFDAAAFVGDRVLGNDSKLSIIGWTDKRWKKTLPLTMREPYEAVRSSEPFKVLTPLRSTIHSPGLSAVGYSNSTTRTDTAVVLPKERADQLQVDLEDVGIRPIDIRGPEIMFRPSDVVEWLLPNACAVLDAWLVACARECPRPEPTHPWTYDRWRAVELLGGALPATVRS